MARIRLAPQLVAPCGMNCGLCKRYLATARGLIVPGAPACIGCRPRNKTCAFIKSNCDLLKKNKIDFCYRCQDFPCRRLETLNRRYTTKYSTDLVDNLRQIESLGLNAWLRTQEDLWRCPGCGGTVSLHDRKCYDCGRTLKCKS